jgi:spermidine synthase
MPLADKILALLYTPMFLLQGELPIALDSGYWITRGPTRIHIRTSPVTIQSALNLNKPWKMCTSNYRIMAGILSRLRGRRFLMLGVGGGSFFHVVKRWWPEAELYGVEKSPAMYNIARKYFKLPDAHVVIGDAQDLINDTSERYDFILVDVFEGTYPPENFMQEPLVRKLSKHLNPEGLLCMNTARHHRWDIKHRQLQRAFSSVFMYADEVVSFEGRLLPVAPHNVVVLGTNSQAVAQKLKIGRRSDA